MMHDTHCHLDLYADPYQVALDTEKSGITTIAVTNLPSAYFDAKPHMRRFRMLRLAIGLHPLLAERHTVQEKDLFRTGIRETRFVGEIGLDFSRHGINTKELQLDSFRFVLSLLQEGNRFVTLHSRGAENVVLDLLGEYEVGPVVFHWYSGLLKTLQDIVDAGHYFSINTSMIRTENGTRIIGRIPRERILTETDGPFIKIGKSPAIPSDVNIILNYLSESWGLSRVEVEHLLERNLLESLKQST